MYTLGQSDIISDFAEYSVDFDWLLFTQYVSEQFYILHFTEFSHDIIANNSLLDKVTFWLRHYLNTTNSEWKMLHYFDQQHIRLNSRLGHRLNTYV